MKPKKSGAILLIPLFLCGCLGGYLLEFLLGNVVAKPRNVGKPVYAIRPEAGWHRHVPLGCGLALSLAGYLCLRFRPVETDAGDAPGIAPAAP